MAVAYSSPGGVPTKPDAGKELASAISSVVGAAKDVKDAAKDKAANMVKDQNTPAATPIQQPGGGASSGDTTSSEPTESPATEQPTQAEELQQSLSATIGTEAPDIKKSDYYDTAPLEGYLKQQLDAAQQQASGQIDRAVSTEAEDLNRALDNAASGYQTQRNQVARDEAIALDNSALYSEMRGDDGGVGRSQYDAIQAAAAQNQLSINQQQTQLAADTARQIADLRAQGEFDKADKLLSLTQTYLGQLISIEQWGQQYNLSVDQINQAIDQWKANYEQNARELVISTQMKEAGLTGMYNGQKTLDAQRQEQADAQELIGILKSYGITPTEEQIAQLGVDPTQVADLQKALTKKKSGGGINTNMPDIMEQTQILLRSPSGGVDATQTMLDNARLSGAIDQQTYKDASSLVAAKAGAQINNHQIPMGRQ